MDSTPPTNSPDRPLGGGSTPPEAGHAVLLEGRRRFLLLGAALIAGCASTERVGDLPDPVWPQGRPPTPPTGGGTRVVTTPPPAPTPVPAPTSTLPGVVPRRVWAKGGPVPSRMNSMTRIGHITIHHDGMSPFLAVDQRSSMMRIELIRSGHRGKNWGDIGYHFIVDRGGRVYEGRPLTYQGAHVRDRNQGNIGILCVGNFEAQSPSDAQMRALAAHVRTLRRRYGVAMSNVRTHREWPGASTLCPGRNLHPRVVAMRNSNAFA